MKGWIRRRTVRILKTPIVQIGMVGMAIALFLLVSNTEEGEAFPKTILILGEWLILASFLLIVGYRHSLRLLKLFLRSLVCCCGFTVTTLIWLAYMKFSGDNATKLMIVILAGFALGLFGINYLIKTLKEQ